MLKKIGKKFYYHLIFITLLSMFLRIALLLHSGPMIEYDTPLYLEHTYNLYDGKGFSVTDYLDTTLKPTAYRMPLFQCVMAYSAKILSISKENIPLVGVMINIILSTIMVFLSVFIAFIITQNEKISILTGYLSSINPNLIYNSVLVLTDTTFSFIIAIFILITILSIKNASKSYLFILSGVILGLSVLTRPITKFYFIFHIFLLFFILKENYRDKIKKIIFFSSSYLIIISPWIIRNYYKLGFLGLETNQGLNTLWSTARFINITKKDKEDKVIHQIKKIIIETMKTESWPMKAEIDARKKLKLSEVDACKYLEKIGIETIISSPVKFIKIFIRNIANNITSSTAELKLIDLILIKNYYERQHEVMITFENIENKKKKEKLDLKDFFLILPNFIFRIIHLLLFVLFITVVYKLSKEEKEISLFLFILISYFILLTSVVGSYDRYRLPYEIILNFTLSYFIFKVGLKKIQNE